jgi:cytochrome P450 family 12
MTSVQNDYGEIAKLPGFLGKRDMVFLFDPKDIETTFRNEGKYPVRRGLETLEYFRGVYKKEWFEKGAGLVPT